jgi:hypothetical protein
MLEALTAPRGPMRPSCDGPKGLSLQPFIFPSEFAVMVKSLSLWDERRGKKRLWDL